jgi:hypothetical protein
LSNIIFYVILFVTNTIGDSLMVDLRQCSGNSAECFASDPEALDFARFNGDMGLHRNNQALIDGAVEAAQQGIPFDEATYRPVSFIDIQSGTHSAPQSIVELGEEDLDGELKLRVARCAYACGNSAVGSCPFIKQQ